VPHGVRGLKAHETRICDWGRQMMSNKLRWLAARSDRTHPRPRSPTPYKGPVFNLEMEATPAIVNIARMVQGLPAYAVPNCSHCVGLT
jgi:hypothetical protein